MTAEASTVFYSLCITFEDCMFRDQCLVFRPSFFLHCRYSLLNLLIYLFLHICFQVDSYVCVLHMPVLCVTVKYKLHYIYKQVVVLS
jgi:hypothetical protein